MKKYGSYIFFFLVGVLANPVEPFFVAVAALLRRYYTAGQLQVDSISYIRDALERI